MSLFGPPDVARLESRGQVQGLIKALGYPGDAGVRQAAAQALGGFQDQEAVQALTEALVLDAEVRSQAAEALVSVGTPQARQALLETVQRPEKAVHTAVREAIVKKGTAELVQPLAAIGTIAALDALAALRQLGLQPAAATLIELLQAGDPALRFRVAILLGSVEGEEARKALIGAAGDTDPRVRDVAVRTLRQATGEEEPARLVQLLSGLGSREAIDALAGLLGGHGPVEHSALQALEALAVEGTTRSVRERALRHVIALTEDKRSAARPAAQNALERLGEAAVPVLARLLRERPGAPALAIRQLARIDSGEAIALLARTLTDPRRAVREQADRALQSLQPRPAASHLIDLLEDTSPDVRRTAATLLGAVDTTEVQAALLPGLDDDSAEVRKVVLSSLLRAGHPLALTRLRDDLSSGSAETRQAAAGVLARLGPERARQALSAALGIVRSSREPRRDGLDITAKTTSTAIAVDTSSVRALLEFGQLGLCALIGMPLVEPLIDLASDAEPTISGSAVKALTQIARSSTAKQALVDAQARGILDTTATTALLVSLWHPDGLPTLALEVAVGVRDNKGAQAVHRLSLIAKAPHPATRERAVRLLGRFGAAAMEPLHAALEDDRDEVRLAATRGLGGFASNESLAPLVARLDDTAVAVRIAAVRALARLGGVASVAPLTAALGDSREEVRAAACEALGGLGRSEAVEALSVSVSDEADVVRMAGIRALSRLGGAPAVDPLATALGDPERTVSSAAFDALVGLGLDEAIEPLSTILRSDLPEPSQDWRPRLAAEALGKMSSPAAFDALCAAASEPRINDWVRRVIANALSKAGNPAAIGPLEEALSQIGIKHVPRLVGCLEGFGWQPNRGTAGAAYWAHQEDWQRCSQCDGAAARILEAVEGGAAAATTALYSLAPTIEDREIRARAAKAVEGVVEQQIAQLGSSTHHARTQAAEELIAAFNSGLPAPSIRALIQDQRATIVRRHMDRSEGSPHRDINHDPWCPGGKNHDDHGGYSHKDGGIGVDFPL